MSFTVINNYEFCAQWVIDRAESRPVKVLDYGCGFGEIVRLLRDREIDSFGCDVFYDAADYTKLEQDPLFNIAIRQMDAGKIPFEDNYFDFIVSNQVIEHVEDLDLTLSEFRRVLKSGGQILNIFPDKNVWREGHCDIPFLHWFPKGSKLRVYYAFLLRSIGLGSFKGELTPMEWSQKTCNWLDQWTYYRTSGEIDREYTANFSEFHSIEVIWLQQRLGHRKSLVAWLPKLVQQLIVRKFAGRMIVAGNMYPG
jgi:SAM-dependent methyltransferase